MILLGIHKTDIEADAEYIINKILNTRMIDQDNKRVSVKEAQQEILLVSQFTLYGYTKGTKVDFSDAMSHDEAYKMYNFVLEQIEKVYPNKTKTGFFGKMMNVQISNDGPFTLMFDSRPNGPEDTRYLIQYASYKKYLKQQKDLQKQQKAKEQVEKQQE